MDKSLMSLKTIADKLNLSQTTVSRVLSGQSRKYRISVKTEKAVLAISEELNFSPNKVAQSLRLNKSHTIGLIVPDISNPFFSCIAREITNEARKNDYSIVLCDSQENTSLEIEAISFLRSNFVAGLIILPVGQSSEHLKKLEQCPLPIVLVDRCFPDLKMPYVASDNFKGAFEAVEYLISNGHKSIACIQGLTGTEPNNQRIKGYREALKKHNIAIDESLIVGDNFEEQNGYIQTKLLIKSGKRISAIFAFSNLIGLGVIRAMKEEQLKIPEDISLICFDDQPYHNYLVTAMTTIRQNTTEVGNIAFRLLFSQIKAEKKSYSEGVLLPTSLVIRDSVKAVN